MQGKEENQIRVTLTPTDIGDIKLRNLPAILLFQLHGLFTVYPASNAGLFILTGIALVPRGRVEHVSDLPPACDFTYVFYS